MKTDSPQLLTARQLIRRIHLLNDFREVAKAGGIRQAAGKVHLSQPALTRRIQELENELGLALFERTSRGMKLSPFGKSLLHHAELIDLTCNYAVGELNDLLEGAAGTIRVAAGPAWAYSIVPDAISRLQSLHPRIRVTLMSRMNDATLPMLAAGELDVVLGGLPPESERHPDIVYEPITEIEQLIFASKDHPLAGKRTCRAEQLIEFPWVWLLEAITGREMLAEFFTQSGHELPPSAVETTSVQCGLRLLQNGQYLMLLPSTLAEVAASYGLMALKTRHPVGHYVAGLMYRKALLRLQSFIKFRDLVRAISLEIPQCKGTEKAQVRH